MKKLYIILLLAVAGLSTWAAADNTPEVMRKQSDGTYIINTTTLCDTKGFRDVTPVEVHIKNGKVVNVVPLKNNESPSYFQKVKTHLLPIFTDTKVGKAKKLCDGALPDGCTGATYSSRAVRTNIAKALEYYEAHK